MKAILWFFAIGCSVMALANAWVLLTHQPTKLHLNWPAMVLCTAASFLCVWRLTRL